MKRYGELIFVVLALLTPQFLLASKVDADEFVKAGIGVGIVAVPTLILGAYKIWAGKTEA
jgi:hypothetical protein